MHISGFSLGPRTAADTVKTVSAATKTNSSVIGNENYTAFNAAVVDRGMR